MNELGIVVLTRALPEHGLQPGDVGAIVHVYEKGKAFEVEFVAGGGSTVAVVTLDAGDVRPVGQSEILHVRGIPAARQRTSLSRHHASSFAIPGQFRGHHT